MKIFILTGVSFLVGIAGKWFGFEAFEPYAMAFLALGIFLTGYIFLKSTYYRSGSIWPESTDFPERIRITWVDGIKSLITWIDSYSHTYAYAPGLYFTGKTYNPDAPLLVTSNYHLTVYLLLHSLGDTDVRMLIVDTDGINVWCAAGKGVFSSDAIMKQVDRFREHLAKGDKEEALILPKLSLAGVRLKDLKDAGFSPVIGPVYAADIPEFLAKLQDRGRLSHRSEDRIVFGFMSRVFTWLPGFMQYMGYVILLAIGLLFIEQIWGITAPLGIIPLSAVLATAYPLLFPWIPGRRFAVKGIWLGALIITAMGGLMLAGMIDAAQLVLSVFFVIAMSIFIGLTYTGNSAVSNYTRVRRETARFLPLNVLLFAASFITFIVMEGSK